MAVAAAEMEERHPEGAADAGLQVLDPAGETMGRQPFGQGVRLDKGSVYPHRRGLEYAVQCHSSSRHGGALLGWSAARIVAHAEVGRWPDGEQGASLPPRFSSTAQGDGEQYDGDARDCEDHADQQGAW